MYHVPSPTMSRQHLTRKLPWRGFGYGFIYSFLVATLYGLFCTFVFIALVFQSTTEVLQILLVGTIGSLLLGGLPGSVVGAITGWIVGALLARHAAPVASKTIIRLALIVSTIFAIAGNIWLIWVTKPALVTTEYLGAYAIMGLLPTAIYLATSSWVGVKLNRWWQQQQLLSV